MSTMSPIPPGDHKVDITKIDVDGETKFQLTCTCDWEVIVEATPPQVAEKKPRLWAENRKNRHLVIVGYFKDDFPRGDMEGD